MIIRESELKTGLPKKTMSICPECGKTIEATIIEKGGAAVMEKTCKQHGFFDDVIWTDARKYLQVERFIWDGVGVENPKLKDARCPDNCGLCPAHISHCALAILDLTNRCDLKCPICFANANAAGYVYEPTFAQVVDMMKLLRGQMPVPCKAVQFSGGEPTLYPRFIEVLKKSKELGFSQVQAASNGLNFSKRQDFVNECHGAGLNTVYLQFDGMRDEVYAQARGRNLLEIKKRAVEHFVNAKPGPMSTVLVPTIVKGINDDQVGPILDFAVKNRKAVRGVNYQPVAFAGRISKDERKKQRFTLTDLLDRLEEATDGALTPDDFFPPPFVAPISELVGTLKGKPELAFTNHPHCGMATFCYINKDEKLVPVTRFIDVEGMMKEMMRLSKKASGTGTQMVLKLVRAVNRRKSKEEQKKSLAKNFNKYLGKYLIKEKMPPDLDFEQMLDSLLVTGDKKSVGAFTWSTLYIGGMHFQDAYNYDVERLKRCNIHYPTPDGRLIPFCAYNTGHTYRTEVEKKFSVPLGEWKEKRTGA
jgi:hypothetical protein